MSPADRVEHAAIESTEAAFAYRAAGGEGRRCSTSPCPSISTAPRGAGGPRAYLHTAGVAVSDAAGMTISSLVSVFDDFGSCVFVPEAAIVLNSRAGGFTDGPERGGARQAAGAHPGPGHGPVRRRGGWPWRRPAPTARSRPWCRC